MNKKLRKMLATVSAVAMCAVSMTAMTAGAIYTSNPGITQDTISFKIGDTKYVVWQEMTDYYDKPNYKFFISEDGTRNLGLCGKSIFLDCYLELYFFENEEDAEILKEYFKANDIEYTDNYPIITPVVNTDRLEFAKKVKEDTGFMQGIAYNDDSIKVNITDVVNALPEVTLSGDSDCDNKVNINDAVLVMQTIANPDKYSMTMQGIANADVVGDGDGVTLSDAMAIQDIAASHAFD